MSRTKRMYTQGISLRTMEKVDAEYERCTHTGSFEVIDMGMMTCSQVIAIVRMLPVPVESDSRPHVCPPCIGFSEPGVCGNVARIESGEYAVLHGGDSSPHSMTSIISTVDEVEAWVKSKFEEGT